MDRSSYTQHNAQLPTDQEKGQHANQPASYPSAHAGYITMYPAQSVNTPLLEERRARRSRARRIWRRVIHLFVLDLVICMVLLYAFKDVRNFAWVVRDLVTGESRAVMDDPRIDLPRDCVEVIQWEAIEDDDDDSHHGYSHGVQASVDLPISSDLLYFRSHGSLSHGLIQFVNTGAEDSDVASISVKFFSDRSKDFNEFTRVCRLQSAESKNGVGIFSVQWTHPPKNHRSTAFVTVELPHSAFINAVETYMPLFLHEIGDFRDSVNFNAVSLRTSNLPITAKYLSAAKTRLQTSNSHIAGVFNSTESIELITSNNFIDAGVFLANGGGDVEPSRLELHTSNAHIKAAISLNSTAEGSTGGKFTATAMTSNSPINVDFVNAPVNSILNFQGKTSNAPARAALHETFEGDFLVSTGRWFEAGVHLDDKEDPSGEGRQRRLKQRSSQRGYAEGKVTWGESGDTKLGSVDLHTSNAPAHLYL